MTATWRNGVRYVCAALLATTIWFVAGDASAQSGDTQAEKLFAALPEIPSGQARIFFFREAHFVGSLATARLKVDGTTVGWLNNGTAVFVDRPAGDVAVSVDSTSQFGHAGFNLTLVAGQRYFVPIAAQASPMFSGGGAGYLLGSLKADVHQYCGGGWCTGTIDQDMAMPSLSKLGISSPNPDASHGLF